MGVHVVKVATAQWQFSTYDDELERISKKVDRACHNLYSSPSIIRMIKSRRMRWAGHVARTHGREEERV
jgi:hypothetical protein